MPGNLIRRFASDADWQEGEAEYITLDTLHGGIKPIGFYERQFASQADWNSGTSTDVVVTSDGLTLRLRPWHETLANITASSSWGGNLPENAVDGDTSSYWQSSIYDEPPQDLYFDFGQNQPVVQTIRLYEPTDTTNFVKDFSFYGSHDRSNWVHLLSATTSRSGSWATYTVNNNTAYRYYRFRAHDTHGSYIRVYEIELLYPGRYVASGSWISPWMAHGVEDPYSGTIQVQAYIPWNTSLKTQVRFSSDGGSTYTDWLDVSDGRMPAILGTYLQVKLELQTSDSDVSPIVHSIGVWVSPLHRWTSPLIDISQVRDHIQIALGPTDLRVFCEISSGQGDWQVTPLQFQSPGWDQIQFRLSLEKTSLEDQYLSSVSVWDALVLRMLERPRIEITPPGVTKVIVYTSEGITAVASLDVLPEDEVVYRVEAPKNSSQAYCQAMAEAILAAKGRERLALTCKVPLVTRLRFDELVPVVIPYLGYTHENPYLARVQRMEHNVLASPPHTILTLGDFVPDDPEALVRLLKGGRY